MKELYYINDGKQGYTWDQLLYWCHTSIMDYSWHSKLINGKRKYGYYPKYDKLNHSLINNFFSDFRHNENDGIWIGGYFKRAYIGHKAIEIVEPLRVGKRRYSQIAIYENKWAPKQFQPKRWQITDSYNRIVPSSVIRWAYLGYIPNKNDEVKVKPRRKYWHYSDQYDHDRDFRNKPVAGIHKWRNKGWSKYNRNKAGRASMKRQWYGHAIYAKEILEEYSVTFKMDNREHHHMDYAGYGIRSWKRSKIRHQWERKLR